jgi:serine acetyltransferase
MAQVTISATNVGMAGDCTIGAGASIGANSVQLTIDTTNCPDKETAIKMTKTILDRLTVETFPNLT